MAMTNMINRRHTVLTIIAAALILLATTLTGCRKGSINGDLDGMWQILTIEILPTALPKISRTRSCTTVSTSILLTSQKEVA